MFDRAERDTEELIDDPDSLGGLVAIGVARPEKQSQLRTYRYPQQETKLRETSKVRMKDSLRQVTVTRLDPDTCEVDVKFGKKAGAPPDRLDLIPGGPLGNEVLRDAVTRVARDALAEGGRYRALEALLAKQAPRIKGRPPGEALINGTDVVAAAVDTVRRLTRPTYQFKAHRVRAKPTSHRRRSWHFFVLANALQSPPIRTKRSAI